MKKRLLIGLIIASMIVPWASGITIPMKAKAAESSSSSSGSEASADQSVYDDLHLNTEMNVNDATAPYSEENLTNMYPVSEVYVAANGPKGNVYTLRNGFDRLNDYNVIKGGSDQSVKDGNMHGAYAYYGISPGGIYERNGDRTNSKLGSNTTNSLKKASNDFAGIYATSIEYSVGNGKKERVAELRAYGNDTRYDGKLGDIAIKAYKFASDGSRVETQTIRPTINDSSIYGTEYFYFTRVYAQELDAFFEIKSGDINGDGYDDLFVYAGAYVDKTEEGTSQKNRYAIVDCFFGSSSGFGNKKSLEIYAGPASSYLESGDWKNYTKRRPVVTIATGDINRDTKDEVAIAVSAPTDNSKVADVSNVYVYEGTKNSKTAPKVIPALDKISMANPAKDAEGKAAVSTNVAFGEFLDNNNMGVTALLIAGYETNNSTSNNDSGAYTKGAYRYVYYNSQKGEYYIEDYQTKSLGTQSQRIASSYKTKGEKKKRPTHAPFALACADLRGVNNLKGDGSDMNDCVLFGGEIYDFSVKDGTFSVDSLGFMSMCHDLVTKSNIEWDKEQVWIGDVRVGIVDTDAEGAKYRECFVAVDGTRRDGDINGKDDYYWMNLSVFQMYVKDGDFVAYGTEEGVIADSNRRNDTYGTFISLALPDIDNDSVQIRYKNKYTVISNPEVYAILEASPYFDDVQEAYDYVNNGGTSYSYTKGTSRSNGCNIEQTVGVYAEVEVSLFAEGKFEAELSLGASYEYENTKTTEYTISYNAAGGGTDQVVVFCNKYVYYEYEVWEPAHDGKSGSWKELIMPVPLGQSSAVIDVDEYDRIAESTSSLDTIKGKLLYNTPGDPSSYTEGIGGSPKYAYGKYATTTASNGADISQEISRTEENSHSIEVFLEMNLKIGGGAGFLGTGASAGVTSGTHVGYGHTYSSSEGITFSGTVDNLPVDLKNFSFDWQLLVNNTKMNNESGVWIVGYKTRNVVRPPHMPVNLAVVNVSKRTVELEWEGSSEAAYYEIYIVDDMNNYNKKAVVPYTVTDYVVPDLSPNTTYKFVIRAVGPDGDKSIYSPSVSATTLQDDSNFSITKEPEDANTYVGGSVSFSTTAAYYDADKKSMKVGYEWQVYEDGSWKSLTGNGASTSTLAVRNVTSEMDGQLYRCRVYYNQITLYTRAVAVNVGKADSNNVLTAYNDTQAKNVANESIVTANGDEVKTHNDKKYDKDTISVESGDKTYNLFTDGTNYIWKDEEENFYSCSKAISADSFGRVPEGTTFSAEDISDTAYELKSIDPTARIINVTNDASGKPVTKILDFDSLTVVEDLTTIPSPTYIETEENETGSVYYEYNKVLEAWKSESGEYIFYKLAVENSDEIVAYYYEYYEDGITTKPSATEGNPDEAVAPYETGLFMYDETKVIKVSDDVTYDQNTFDYAYITTSEDIVIYEDPTNHTGDTLILTAAPTSLSGDAIEGNVTFVISGPSSLTIEGTYDADKGVYTVAWNPVGEGVFTVYANYAGNNQYYGSKSESMTIYTSYDDDAALSLSVKENAKYGDKLPVSLMKIDSKDDSSVDVTDSTATEYDVYIQAGSNTVLDYVEAAESDYTLENGVFTPKNIGVYKIVGSNGDISDAKLVTVARAPLAIDPQETNKRVTDEGDDRNCEPATITGLKSWDSSYSPVLGVDYTLVSDGVTAITPGEYPIKSVLQEAKENEYTEKINYLSDRYAIELNQGVYNLDGDIYKVTAETASTHGSVTIEYKQTSDSKNDPLEVENGTLLPEKAEVTITASPNTGYKVKKWKVNRKTVTDASGATTGSTAFKDVQIVVPSLSEDLDFVVEFEPVFHTLSYGSNNPDFGTVSAVYVDDDKTVNDTVFTSGSNIHIEQKFKLTAKAAEGYVVDHWTVKTGDEDEKVVLADDNKTYYSESTYDVENISEDTVITAYFVAANDYKITLTAVTETLDGSVSPAVGTKVVVKSGDGTEVTKNADDEYIVSKGDNVTIEITVPSGLLIDNWKVADGQKIGTVSDKLTKMTIYNITGDADYTVTFKAPNRYKVSFELDDTAAADISAIVDGTTTALVSGDKQIQGSDIIVTTKPNDGYEIASWTVDGKEVTSTKAADGSESYKITNLVADSKVLVKTYKKPIITLDADGSADSSIKLGDDALESGDVITYADENKITFAATTEKGYEVDDVVVVYGDKVLYKKSAEIADDLVVFTEDKDSTTGTELYTVELTAPEGGFIKDVDVKITFKEIAPVISAKYSLVSIDNTAKSTHGKIAAGVVRKELSAYVQTGDEVVNTEAEITDIYRDSVVTFTVTPDEGYNVKEWAINGTVIDAESDTIKITKTNKTNDTLIITVDKDATDLVVTARLELVGDVLTFDVEPAEYGEIAAQLKATKHDLKNGEMIGTTGKAEFTVDCKDDYEVVGWKINGLYALNEDGENVSDNPYTYTVEAGTRAHVTAILDRKEYDITYSAEDGGSIDAFNTTEDVKLAEGTDKVRGGRKLQFEVTPDEYMMLSYYTITDADGERVVKAEDLEGDVLVIDSVESDITVVATFEKYVKKIKVTYEANDDDMGSVAATYNLEGEDIAFASEDEIVAGNKVDFVATPAEGYLVEGWYADPDFRELLEKSEDELTEYSFDKVDDDLEVYVKFIEIPTYEISLDVTGTGVGSLTAKVNDEEATIEDGKVYVKKHGTVEITAVPKDEFNTLETWKVNDEDEILPDDITYTFTDVKADQKLVAKFSPALVVDVTFKGDREADHYADINIEAGYVDEDKLTEIDAENAIARIGSGKDVKLEIAPEEGYMLDSWTVKYSVNGVLEETYTSEDLGYANKLVLSNVQSNIEVTATLKEKLGFMVPAEGSYDYDGYKLDEEAYEEDSFDEATAYTISDLELNPTDVTFEDEEGDVIPNKVREHGDATFKVTPGKDKVVLSIEASEGADMEVTENEDGSYDVKLTNVVCDVELYVEVIPTYKLTIKECENGKITAIGTEDGKEYKDGDMIPFGTKITFTAVPDTHYAFESWTDVVLREILIIDPSDVSDDDPPMWFSDDNPDDGNPDDGIYDDDVDDVDDDDDDIDIDPDPETPNVPTENPFDYVMLEETVIGATFAPIMVTINIEEPTNGSIEVKTADGTVLKTGDQVQEGTEIECTATPDAHYAFEAWGGDVSEQKDATFKMSADADTKISATFKPIMVIVDIDETVNGKIEVRTPDGTLLTNGSQVQEGTTITCTAIPAANCSLGSWNGSITGNEDVVKVVADANITIGAKFIAKDADSAGINKNIQARLKGKKITFKWGKVSEADGYEVFVQECYSEKTKAQKIKTLKGASKTKTTITKYLGKSIKKYKELKIRVKAYKKVNGKKKYIDTSEMLHIVTNHKKLTNVKKNTPKKKSVTLEVGKKTTIKTKLTKAEKKKSLLSTSHGKRLRYYSTNKNVAKVSKKGKVTAVASGTCTIYVISVSGVTAAVKVTVK